MELKEVPIVSEMPGGYRRLGYFQDRETGRAALFDYRGQRVWIPTSTLRFKGGKYWAPKWAIDSSRQFQQEQRG